MTDPEYKTRKEVARANRRFYEIFEELDFPAMVDLWLDSPAIQCVHPGGEALVGPERVHASWRAILEHTEAIRFDVTDLAIEIYGEVAWVGCVERIRTGTEGTPAEMGAATTNLFVKRDGEWKIALHHASPIARRFFSD